MKTRSIKWGAVLFTGQIAWSNHVKILLKKL